MRKLLLTMVESAKRVDPNACKVGLLIPSVRANTILITQIITMCYHWMVTLQGVLEVITILSGLTMPRDRSEV